MASEKRQTSIALDTSLLDRAMAYGAANSIPFEALVEQGLRLRLDGPPGPAEGRALPDLEALADRRIREQLPGIVREWLESARGAECLKRLIVPHVPEAAPHVPEAVPHVPEAADAVDVPPEMVERLQLQSMIRLEKASGVDVPTLHAIRTGKLTRLPKEALETLVAGLEQVESENVYDFADEGLHG